MIVVLSTVLLISFLTSKCLPIGKYLNEQACTWLIFTSIINIWDASFLLYRPDSLYHPIWAQSHSFYIQVDTLYLDMKNNFSYSVPLMNLFEVVLNFISLFFMSLRRFKTAGMVAVVVSSMTLSKTIMYILMEIVSGFEHTKQNDPFTLLTFYLFPTMIWVYIPLAVIVVTSTSFIEDNDVETKKDN